MSIPLAMAEGIVDTWGAAPRIEVAVASPVPPDRKVPERAAPVREAVAGWIDEMLREDLAAPRKQRHTARRVFERLAEEHDAQVSYSYVAKYVARRRAEIAAQDRDGAEGLAGFVPQPGSRGPRPRSTSGT